MKLLLPIVKKYWENSYEDLGRMKEERVLKCVLN
jgi:hypothetical protein